MISNLSELVADGLFEPLTSINTKPSNNPSVGDIYYDTSKNRNYVFDDGTWKELKINSKNALFNKVRMRKIERLFS